MRLTRLLLKQRFWNPKGGGAYGERFSDWFLNSRNGFWCRMALLTAPVVVYPIGSLLINGPLIGKTFKWRYDLEDKLPEHLQKIVDEEIASYMERNNRKKRDTVVEYHVQRKMVDTDSIVKGTIGIRAGGARVGLPFFTQFRSFDEAKDYCRKKLEPFTLFDATACIIWESDFGRELIDTFVLSEKAIRFLIYRDLMSCENYQALVNAPIIVGSYTTFSSFFTYALSSHAFKKWQSAKKFFLFYTVFTAMAIFGALQYHKFYYYSTNYYADEMTAKISTDYTDGGMEYYRKMLRRHRLLRGVLDKGPQLFTPPGNLNGVGLNYVFRYGKLRDMTTENDELAPVFEGDDF